MVRADHPEVTIIMPGEKIQVHPGDDVRRLITPYVAVIRQALDGKRVGEWKGYTAECRIRQVRRRLPEPGGGRKSWWSPPSPAHGDSPESGVNTAPPSPGRGNPVRL